LFEQKNLPIQVHFHRFLRSLLFEILDKNRVHADQSSMTIIFNQVRDYARSIVVSQAWKPEFKRELETSANYDTFAYNDNRNKVYDNDMPCEVCLLGQYRVASTTIRVGSSTYMIGPTCYSRSKLYHNLWHFVNTVRKTLRDYVWQVKKDFPDLSDTALECYTIGKSLFFDSF
jgi:hypothetical protein